MKKILSFILATAMLLSLGAPALAFAPELPEVPEVEGPFGSQDLAKYDDLEPGEIHAVKHVTAIENDLDEYGEEIDPYNFQVQLDVLGKGFTTEADKPMMLAILVDLSTSMQNKIDYENLDAEGNPTAYRYGSKEWNASTDKMVMDYLKEALTDFVDEFLGANKDNRLTIYGWGLGSTVIVDNWSGSDDLVAIKAAIAAMHPDHGGTNMQQAYHLAGRLLARVGYHQGYTIANARANKLWKSTSTNTQIAVNLALEGYADDAKLSDVFDAAAIVFTDGCPTASYSNSTLGSEAADAVLGVEKGPGGSTTNAWGASYTDDIEKTRAIAQAEYVVDAIPGLDIYNVCTYDGIKELYDDEEGTVSGVSNKLLVGLELAKEVLDAGFAAAETEYVSANEITDAFKLINQRIETRNDPGFITFVDTIGPEFEYVGFIGYAVGVVIYEGKANTITWQLDVRDNDKKTFTFEVRLKDEYREKTGAYLTNVHKMEKVTLDVTPTDGNPYYVDEVKTHYYVPGNYQVIIPEVTISGAFSIDKMVQNADGEYEPASRTDGEEGFVFKAYTALTADGKADESTYVATAVTDTQGRATFTSKPATEENDAVVIISGKTYYIFEELSPEQSEIYQYGEKNDKGYIEVVAVENIFGEYEAPVFYNDLKLGQLTITKKVEAYKDYVFGENTVTGGFDADIAPIQGKWQRPYFIDVDAILNGEVFTGDLVAGSNLTKVGEYTVSHDGAGGLNVETELFYVIDGVKYPLNMNDVIQAAFGDVNYGISQGGKNGIKGHFPEKGHYKVDGNSFNISKQYIDNLIAEDRDNDGLQYLYIHMGIGMGKDSETLRFDITDQYAETEFEFQVLDSEGEEVAAFALKDGKSFTLDLEAGEYTVVEITTGWTATYSVEGGVATVAAGIKTEVTVTNLYVETIKVV